MKSQIRSYSHAVGEFNYHIQLTPAYRKRAMEDERVNKLVKAYISAKLQQLKGFSSYMIRKNHWTLIKSMLWGDKFWSEGYFCRSIGSTTTDAVEYYIKYSQDTHWKNVDYEVYQAQLDQFSVV